MDELNINQVDYKWVDDTEDARMLKKGLRLLKEDGGHFPHLENYIEDKLLKIDKKFKTLHESKNANVSPEELLNYKEDILTWEKEMKKSENLITDNKEVSSLQRKKQAENEKTKGNDLMRTKEYEGALNFYNSSINLDAEEPTTYCNRALAYINLKQYNKAIEDCNKAIQLKSDYSKAYFRRALCYTQQRKFELALKDLLYILKDAPDNKEILDELKKLKENWDLDLNEKEREGLELRFKEEIANVKQNLHRNTKGIEQTKTPANKDTPVVDATSKASTGFKKIKIVEEDIPSPKVVSPELEIKFAKFMQAGDNVKKQLDSLIKRNLINEAKEVATNCVRDCQHFRNEFETNSDYYVKLSNAITELNTLIEQINSSSSNTKTQKEETKQGQIPKDTARSSADSDSSKYYKTNILSKDLRETATKIAEANINFDDFPKSAFGFEKAFNSFKGKPDVFFNFLKFFTGKTMSNSYQVSEIPYQILAGVILCLRSNLNEDNAELVVDYLRNIPKTKNFQLVKKFLKKSDKENIREICSKLKDKFNITEDFAGLYL